MLVFRTFLKNEIRQNLDDVQTDITYDADAYRCERNLQFGTWFSRGFVRSIFLPRLQGNNRIAFLSWP